MDGALALTAISVAVEGVLESAAATNRLSR